MPCRDALISDVVTLSPEMSFGEALHVLETRRLRSAPVVDAEGSYKGMFSLNVIFRQLLPLAVSMEGGLDRVDFMLGASQGVAKKLKKLMPTNISEYLSHDLPAVHPETSIVELMRIFVRHGSPVPVVERGGHKFAGLVSEQSVLTAFRRLREIKDKANSGVVDGHLSPDDIALLKEFGFNI